MAVVTKVECPSLKIVINKPPIVSIELANSLTKLIVTLDTQPSYTAEFFGKRKHIADIIRPPKPEIGILCMDGNRVQVSQCTNQKFLEFVHTIQVPVQALHAAGFLTGEQVDNITSYVLCHALRPSKIS